MTKFRAQLEVLYEEVKLVKPPCSRDNSAEVFLYAKGLKTEHVSHTTDTSSGSDVEERSSCNDRSDGQDSKVDIDNDEKR